MGRNYSRKLAPVASDLALIWDDANSDWRVSPLSAVSKVVGGLLPFLESAIQQPVSQYLSPATDFTITLEGTDNIHLILTPSVTIADGTITLPVNPGVVDKQTVTVTTSAEVTALTVAGNGSTVVGAPTTLATGAFFTLKFDMQTGAWYRVA